MSMISSAGLLQCGMMQPFDLPEEQSPEFMGLMLPSCGQQNDCGIGQGLMQVGQQLVQAGQQLMQEGQQLMQQGDFQQGMQLVQDGAQLEQQGAGLEMQGAEATDPFGLGPSPFLDSMNGNNSQALSQLQQTMAQLQQDMTSLSNNMSGMTGMTGPMSIGSSSGSGANAQSTSSSGQPVSNSGSAQAILQETAAQDGWGSGSEWQALSNVENAEAGFNPTAENASSGALGLAQALGHGNANTAGTLGNQYGGYGLTDAQAKAANSGNAADQALWMVNYIKSTYGNPEAAWAHEEADHWY
jgi:hypothetical protein